MGFLDNYKTKIFVAMHLRLRSIRIIVLRSIPLAIIMKGTKMQTLGAVAGAWPVAWVRGNY